jgi:hypothetical protein
VVALRVERRALTQLAQGPTTRDLDRQARRPEAPPAVAKGANMSLPVNAVLAFPNRPIDDQSIDFQHQIAPNKRCLHFSN